MTRRSTVTSPRPCSFSSAPRRRCWRWRPCRPRDLPLRETDFVASVPADERHDTEHLLRRRDGAVIVTNLRSIRLPTGLVMAFCVNITEHERAEAQIHSLAYFDPLTDLPNRRLLNERLAQAMAASEASRTYSALLILDLDHFKDLNDTRGHDVGDRLLTEVGRRIAARAGNEDTVARIGGDESALIAADLGMRARQLHFQPQVDRDGRIVGAEALVRWTRSDVRPISPARFVPLAEESGLIVPMGLWVLERTCAQLRAWQADARLRELVLSVNVSARRGRHEPDLGADRGRRGCRDRRPARLAAAPRLSSFQGLPKRAPGPQQGVFVAPWAAP